MNRIPQPRRRSRTKEVACGLFSLVALIALIFGLPGFLLLAGSQPLSWKLPTWHQFVTGLISTDDGSILIGSFTIIGWLSWLGFAVSVCIEMASYFRRRPPFRPYLLTPFQGITAALLATTVALINTATPPISQQFPELPTISGKITPVVATTTMAPIQLVNLPTKHSASVTTVEYVVQRYDTLWDIAERQLGNARRYREVFELNKGRIQSDGQIVKSPDWLIPGWILLLPAEEGNESNRSTSQVTVNPGDTLSGIAERHLGNATRWEEIFRINRGRQQPDGRQLDHPNLICPGWTLILPTNSRHSPSPDPIPESAPADTATSVPRSEDSSVENPNSSSVNSPSTAPSTVDNPGIRTGSIDAQRRHASPNVVVLSSGAIVGLSLAAGISAAIALARLQRRRRRIPEDPTSAEPEPPLSTTVGTLNKAWHATNQNEHAAPLGSTLSSPSSNLSLAVGVDLDQNSEIDIWLAAVGGLGLTGPGAVPAARALLVSLLASPVSKIEVVIPAEAATQLLGSFNRVVPRLRITTNLSEALRFMETAMFARARIIEELDAPDLESARLNPLCEPIPTTVLVANVPEQPGILSRAQAICELGRTHELAAVMLGDWPTGTTCNINVDGKIITNDGLPSALARIFQLDSSEATELLEVLVAAGGYSDSTNNDVGAIANFSTMSTSDQPGPADQASCVTNHGNRITHNEKLKSTGVAIPQPVLKLMVLGRMRIYAAGIEITHQLRPKLRDLLGYLALHPDGGVPLDSITDALWPHAPSKRGRERFHATLRETREILTDTTGCDDLIQFSASRYQLLPEFIETDLLHFNNALDEYRNANDVPLKIEALTRATDFYRGDLLTDTDYEWLLASREHLRQQAVDSLAKLAELHVEAPEKALTALAQAIDLDPYNECLYQRVMRLHARNGDRAAIRQTMIRLETKLLDLDVEPSEETLKLVNELNTI